MTTPSRQEDPGRQGAALRLVDQVLDLPRGDRDAALTTLAGADAPLLAEARRLLEACDAVDGGVAFLAEPASALAEPLVRAVNQYEHEQEGLAIPGVFDALDGRYRVIREVGRGGSAVVFLARDLKHGRDVAIKVIHHGIADRAQRARFLHEISIAAQLSHPHVVSLIDSGEAGEAMYYVMRFVEGESLRQRLDREGALPVGVVVSIARDVAEALDHAHAAGIVHRDIKPQNILLGAGHAMVADFGIALALEATLSGRVTEAGVAVGTPAYMSPEQATASTGIDARSDVYSLACVVYEMLAGETPYQGTTPRAVIAKHLSAPVPDLTILRPSVAPGVQRVLERALAKAPADRPASAGAFVAELERAVREGAPRRRPVRRLAAAGAVAGLGAALWLATRDGDPATRAATAAAADSSQRRIAVLYFDALTPDPDAASLAQGITEDLIDELSQVAGLHVISPDGVRPFRHRAVPIDSVASVLGVGTVVGGSVSAADGSVRASVRMIDPVTRRQLQSRTFDQPEARALVLRDTIVRQVAMFLRERLGQEVRLRQQRSETRSLAAWQRVRRAQDIARDGAQAAREGRETDALDLLTRADSLYAAAEALDERWLAPPVGRGWVSLSLALTRPDLLARARAASAGAAPEDPATTAVHHMLRAVAHANRALQRQAGAAEALALRGFAHHRLAMFGDFANRDSLWRLAEADLRSALDERPGDARSWYALGELYWWTGRYTESVEALERAWDHDAFLTESRALVSQAFHASLYAGRTGDARRWCQLGRGRYPGDPRFVTCELIFLGWTGRSVRDVSTARRMVAAIEGADSVGMFATQWSFLRLMVAAIAARGGMADTAAAILRDVSAGERANPGRQPSHEAEAWVRLLMGDREGAKGVLVREVARDGRLPPQVARSPWFRDLGGDPEFRAMVAGAGSPAVAPRP